MPETPSPAFTLHRLSYAYAVPDYAFICLLRREALREQRCLELAVIENFPFAVGPSKLMVGLVKRTAARLQAILGNAALLDPVVID